MTRASMPTESLLPHFEVFHPFNRHREHDAMNAIAHGMAGASRAKAASRAIAADAMKEDALAPRLR